MITPDSSAIVDYLNFMCAHGKSGMTFTELEDKFGLTKYNDPGNRAKKLWYSFNDEGLSIDEYVEKFVTDSPVVSNQVLEQTENKAEWTYGQEAAYFSGTTEKVITNLEQALEFSKVDTTVWEVDRWNLKTWDVTAKIKTVDPAGNEIVEMKKRVNYGVQVWLKRKAEIRVDLDMVMEFVRTSIKTYSGKPVTAKRGIGVLNLADFHIGADISDLLKTPDFNVDILVGHLNRIAETVNTYQYNELHVNLLGDYFESISGLNHLNTFKSLGKGMYGAKVIKLGITVIAEFLKKLNNLKSINVLSGNHDRVTADNRIDNEGAAAEILAFGLQLIFGEAVVIDYHPYLISKDIDGICYLLTHGHYSMDKKDPAKIVKQYGSSNLYTIWMSGHIHTRKTEKFIQRRPISYESFVAVSLDEVNYRKVVVPSLFTGNFYSETLGYTSCGGFILVENNGSGKPNVYDFSI